MKSCKFIISGKVQGVYYRVNVKKNALKLNYKGYVKNLSNGTVEAGVTCEESQLDAFIEILKKGSQQSKVTNIAKSEHTTTFSNPFEVR